MLGTMSAPGAPTDDSDLTAQQVFLLLLLKDGTRGLREDYCRVVGRQLENIASWLAIDAWLGGGDQRDPAKPTAMSPDRRDGFSGLSLVVQIAAELTQGAIALIDEGRSYAAAALIRQLLECEYLLESFRQDFDEAKDWYRASDRELRSGFSPYRLRDIGGFSDAEYRSHCERGGHPHPRGAYLLSIQNEIRKVHSPENDAPVVDRNDDLWLDFAHHLQRVWSLQVRLLTQQHARFAKVRAGQIAAVVKAEEAWLGGDRLAEEVVRTRLVNLVRVAPSTTLPSE
jgi:hypothetical protein